MTNFFELESKLNPFPCHELYWNGRADVFGIKNVIQISVLEEYSMRIYPIMKDLGFKLMEEHIVDMGDDDCHKLEVISSWKKA